MATQPKYGQWSFPIPANHLHHWIHICQHCDDPFPFSLSSNPPSSFSFLGSSSSSSSSSSSFSYSYESGDSKVRHGAQGQTI